MEFKKYTIQSNIYSQTTNIKTSNTNSVEFYNIGSVAATINGTMPLVAGGILSFPGNQNEIIDPNFNITLSFQNTTGAKVLVIQKNYV